MVKKTRKSTELHPMLLKGMVIGLMLGLIYMFYVNSLRDRYEGAENAVQGIQNSALK